MLKLMIPIAIKDILNDTVVGLVIMPIVHLFRCLRAAIECTKLRDKGERTERVLRTNSSVLLRGIALWTCSKLREQTSKADTGFKATVVILRIKTRKH